MPKFHTDEANKFELVLWLPTREHLSESWFINVLQKFQFAQIYP